MKLNIVFRKEEIVDDFITCLPTITPDDIIKAKYDILNIINLGYETDSKLFATLLWEKMTNDNLKLIFESNDELKYSSNFFDSVLEIKFTEDFITFDIF